MTRSERVEPGDGSPAIQTVPPPHHASERQNVQTVAGRALALALVILMLLMWKGASHYAQDAYDAARPTWARDLASLIPPHIP
ncbi:MAG: hypothetical protein HYY04_07600 [Chloroflexi bacterium]|nr:hypothetical protein [Chloroflexota bacterium]